MDRYITIDVQKMEDYLNTEFYKRTIRTPITHQNYLDTMNNIFKILKQFEVSKTNIRK